MNTDMSIGYVREVAWKYKTGELTKKEALELIDPYVQKFNKKSRELAKKYNQKPKLFNFASFCR